MGPFDPGEDRRSYQSFPIPASEGTSRVGIGSEMRPCRGGLTESRDRETMEMAIRKAPESTKGFKESRSGVEPYREGFRSDRLRQPLQVSALSRLSSANRYPPRRKGLQVANRQARAIHAPGRSGQSGALPQPRCGPAAGRQRTRTSVVPPRLRLPIRA